MRSCSTWLLGIVSVFLTVCACSGTTAHRGSNSTSAGATGSSGSAGTTGTSGRSSGSSGGQASGSSSGSGSCLRGVLCQTTCCPQDSICVGAACEPLHSGAGSCATDADCEGDTYCDAGACVSWEDGGFDPSCEHPAEPAHFSPSIRCAWPPVVSDGGYAAETDPENVQVITTPLTADFGTYPVPHPLVVFPSQNSLGGGSDECVGTDTAFGLIRILDPQACAVIATLDAADQHVVGSSTPAIGDLNGDGHPDIVAAAVGGGLVALQSYSDGGWGTLWHSHFLDGGPDGFYAGQCNWAGPSLADIEGDGLPDVAFGGAIYDHTGLLIDESLGTLAYSAGQIPVLANVDLDGGPELITGVAIYQYDRVARAWAMAPYFMGTNLTDGFVAVGRFGSYPVNGADPGYPQIAVVGGGEVRVQTIGGEVIFGPYALPAMSSGGGPPTLGDFNGDGQPDIAAAGSDSYTVFSFHCVTDGGPLPSDCLSEGVLWTQQSQDHSSNVTGSSLFDFTGSGVVSGLYADECFARVYDGPTGVVTYSQWHSSCTWYENPVVADVLANYSSQMIVISNQNCAVDCSGSTEDDGSGRQVDTTFAGLTCTTAADCPSANATCAAGLCRCTVDDDCCGTPGGCPASGFGCGVPPASGQPSLGKTCRAIYGNSYPGIRIYADAQNRWVDSRPIWNQHAYAVTNVLDDGTIPAASAIANNWLEPGLNNFREQVQGELTPLAAAHLTIAFTSASCSTSGAASFELQVCNRGAGGVVGGIPISVDTAPGISICAPSTVGALSPGACTSLPCTWSTPTNNATLTATVDPMGITRPCSGGENTATLSDFSCTTGLR